MSTPSEWAMGEAKKVFYSVNLSGLKYQSAATDLVRNIALALDAARKVPDGCVRLPDGRDIEPPYYVSIVPGLLQPWEAYIERAIVIARKDGTG